MKYKDTEDDIVGKTVERIYDNGSIVLFVFTDDTVAIYRWMEYELKRFKLNEIDKYTLLKAKIISQEEYDNYIMEENKRKEHFRYEEYLRLKALYETK